MDEDEEEFEEEDKVVSVGGKICTISNGASLVVPSFLTLGALSGVLITTVVIEDGDGGRTLSIELPCAATSSLWLIAVLLFN